jgi:hypothetical protein
MRQERVDISGAEHARMPLVMEENETPDPGNVRTFRVGAVVLRAEDSPYTVQKTRPRSRNVGIWQIAHTAATASSVPVGAGTTGGPEVRLYLQAALKGRLYVTVNT